MTDQLKVDLEALERLSPQLEVLATKLADAARKSSSSVISADSPSAAAAQRLSGQAIPGLQRTVAARLRTVADWSVQARNGFATTEEDICNLFRASSALKTTRDVPGSR